MLLARRNTQWDLLVMAMVAVSIITLLVGNLGAPAPAPGRAGSGHRDQMMQVLRKRRAERIAGRSTDEADITDEEQEESDVYDEEEEDDEEKEDEEEEEEEEESSADAAAVAAEAARKAQEARDAATQKARLLRQKQREKSRVDGKGSSSSSSDEEDVLTVVYQHKAYHFPYHIDHMLGRVERPVRYVVEHEARCYPHAIVVLNQPSIAGTAKLPPPNSYFAKCSESRVGIFHTGDIRFDQGDYSYYNFDNVEFVYRDHWPGRDWFQQKGLDASHVHLLPLGSLFLDSIALTEATRKRVLPASLRRYDASFVGTVEGYREKFAKQMKAAGFFATTAKFKLHYNREKNFKYFFGGFRSSKNIDPVDYRIVMSESRFVLAPRGTGPDSFRVYEALELGAIPILEDSKHHFDEGAFGRDCPLPTVPKGDWSGVEQVMRDIDDVDALQAEVMDWWMAYRVRVQEDMAAYVEGLWE